MKKQHKFVVGTSLLATAVIVPLMAVANTTTYVREQPTESVMVDYKKAQMTDEQVVSGLVDVYSRMYGVSSTSLMATLRNENDTFEFCRQSELTYKAGNRWGFKAGTREESYGVAQIHLPDHPKVTKEQACDPAFSVEFMARMFSEGRQRMWMGYVKTLR